MKSEIQNTQRRSISTVGMIVTAIVAAGLMSAATAGTADAAGKGVGVKAPAPRAAALTTQEQISRNRGVRPVKRPGEMSTDKKCTTGSHRPHSCFPHQH